jgi:threonine dehydrogenase-like Zn-dependent dehydrogenase
MKALVASGPGRLVVDEVPEPAHGPGQVLVRTRVTAVSAGTELRMLYRAEDEPAAGPDWPVVGAFGYLACGDVVATGPGVTGLAAGDRVTCGTGWGAHAELLAVDAASAQVLPPGLSYLDGACAYWAVPPLCGILAGRPDYYDDVAVVGLGPLGLTAVQLLVPMCRRVIAIDRVAARCTLAAEFGAVAIDATAADVAAEVARVSPGRPGVVIQAAGAQAALELALAIVREQGAVVNVGTLPRLSGFDLFWPMQWSGARVVPIHRPPGPQAPGAGLGGATPPDPPGPGLGRSLRQAHLPDVLDMIGRGRLDLRRLCSWVLPAHDAPRAMVLHRDHPDVSLGLAFAWHPDEVAGRPAFEAAARTTIESRPPGPAASSHCGARPL